VVRHDDSPCQHSGEGNHFDRQACRWCLKNAPLARFRQYFSVGAQVQLLLSQQRFFSCFEVARIALCRLGHGRMGGGKTKKNRAPHGALLDWRDLTR
jgi:hypothetical protein